MVFTIVEYYLYGLCTHPNCCCQDQGICPKKEIWVFQVKEQWKVQKKVELVYAVYIQ